MIVVVPDPVPVNIAGDAKRVMVPVAELASELRTARSARIVRTYACVSEYGGIPL